MIKRLNNDMTLLKRDIPNRLNEVINAVNDLTQEVEAQGEEVTTLMATVYGGEDDEDECACYCDDDDDEIAEDHTYDRCPDCWAETEPFVASLPDLSDEQLHALASRVHDLLDEREEPDDDSYCEQCNDYHDLPDDDDESVTREVQEIVDDVRDKSLRGSSKHPSGETYFVTKDDGPLFDLVKMCINNPDIRLGQAICNVSGYPKAWIEDEKGELKDLWEWRGEKGSKS